MFSSSMDTPGCRLRYRRILSLQGLVCSCALRNPRVNRRAIAHGEFDTYLVDVPQRV